MAQYSNLYSWLFWPTVEGEKVKRTGSVRLKKVRSGSVAEEKRLRERKGIMR